MDNLNCVTLPKKQVILKKENYLSEFSKENEKAEARSNLGITPLLEELRALILTKAIDNAGNLKFGLEPTDGRLNEEAYSQVLSSAVIYDTLQKYYTKNELDLELNYFLRIINLLKQDKINKSEVYTKKLITDKINNLINQINELIESSKITVDDSLSETSSNPVLNKVIKEIINLLEERIDNIPQSEETPSIIVDSELSEDSENPVLNKILKGIIDNLIERLNNIPLEIESVKHIFLTLEEYDSLEEYEKDTLYFIIEQEDINWTFGDTFPIILQ